MINIIISCIGIILIAVAIKSSIKHLKGESSCCGGGNGIIATEKKLTGTKIGAKDILIEGMTCINCQKRIQNALNKIDGVAATVSFRKKRAHIEFDKDIADDLLITTIEKAGYTVSSIQAIS